MIYIEKYRPRLIKDIIGQKDIVEDLTGMLNDKNIPHLLFYGRAGIGKTTAAKCLINELYGQYASINSIELNASDERGIDVIRDKVKRFAKTMPHNTNFKIIFLDEADALTKDSLNALRRIMEQYSKTCRFILCCNYVSKIIEPIRSRCAMYNFRALSIDDIFMGLVNVCEAEHLEYENKALEHIAKRCNGDIRKALGILQSVASKKKGILMNVVKSDKTEGTFLFIISAILNKRDFRTARTGILKLFDEGVTEREFLLDFHNYIINTNIEELPEMLELIRDADKNIILGVYPQFEIDTFLKKAIDLIERKYMMAPHPSCRLKK